MKKYFECLEISSQMYYSYCLVLKTISNILIIIHVYTARFHVLHRSQVTMGIRQSHISMSLWYYLVRSVLSSLRHSPNLFQLFCLRTFGFLAPRDFQFCYYAFKSYNTDDGDHRKRHAHLFGYLRFLCLHVYCREQL